MEINKILENEFDTEEIFRKLIASNEPKNDFGKVQNYFAEAERRSDFLRELGNLCMKYGVGGISELEYHNKNIPYVIINWTFGRHRLLVLNQDDIITIVNKIFAVVATAKK